MEKLHVSQYMLEISGDTEQNYILWITYTVNAVSVFLYIHTQIHI